MLLQVEASVQALPVGLLLLLVSFSAAILMILFANKRREKALAKEKELERRRLEAEVSSGNKLYECPHCYSIASEPKIKVDFTKNAEYPVCPNPECYRPYVASQFEARLLSVGMLYVHSYLDLLQKKIGRDGFEKAQKSFFKDMTSLAKLPIPADPNLQSRTVRKEEFLPKDTLQTAPSPVNPPPPVTPKPQGS